MPSRRHILGLFAAGLASAARAKPVDPAEALVEAARRQIGVTTGYDPAYRQLGYPLGDVPRSTGVCADVVVRAARDAWGVDLQRLLHQDMAAHFGAYPHRWGLAAPDANIDHRRVPNLETYWTRVGARLWRASGPSWGFDFHGQLEPGDILTWRNFMNAGPHPQWLDGADAHFRWRPQDHPSPDPRPSDRRNRNA